MARKIPGRALNSTTVITVANTQANIVVANVVAVGISVNIGDSLTANSSTIHLGNSTVNTIIHTTGVTGNGAGIHSVNAAALQGNTVSSILVTANTAANTLASAAYSNAIAYSGNAALAYANATSYADTVSATAFTNAASRADSAYSNAIAYSGNAALAYSNAIAYAASNTRVNEQLDLRAALAGATFTGAVTVSNTLSVGNNVTITGNLTVTGTRVFANTTTVDLGDNIITLNADIGETTPSENAGFEIHRGTSANVSLLWNESTDKWTLTTDGTTYLNIATNNDVTTAYSNAVSYADSKAGDAYSNAASYADTKAATAFSNAAARADSAYSNAIAYSANATNISSGTVAFARLPALYLGTTQVQSTSAAQAVSGITTLAAGNTTITGFINVSTNTATFGTAAYIVANGNVGIGMPSPIFPLQIKTNTGATSQALQLNTTEWTTSVGSAFQVGFGASSGNTYSEIRALSEGYNVWNNLVLQSGGGNVGIGTTAPYSQLHLTGTTTIGSGTSARPAFKPTNWGYSSSYRALLIGSASTDYTATNTGAVTVAFNYDPSSNPSGSFGGNGSEILFRRGTSFLTPNAADNAFNINITLLDSSVGIGNTTPASGDRLSVNGNVYVSGTLTEASSLALKENIDPITGALCVILGINGYTYDRKDGSRKHEPGLIAEEVAAVLPNVVQYNDEGNPQGIQYTKIIAYLIESIKELKAEIDILKDK